MPAQASARRPACAPSEGAVAHFSEAAAWQAVAPGWRPLHGGFREAGYSLEWHEFRPREELDWAATFHPHCLELCLNLAGTGFVETRTGRLELSANMAGFYYRADEPLHAQRAAGEQHQFLTVEYSSAFLREHLAELNCLHPLAGTAINDPPRHGLVGPAVRLTAAHQHLVATLRRAPVCAAVQPLWYQCKALEFALIFLTETRPEGECCPRQQRLAQERVDRVIFLLSQDLASPPCLEELGRKVGCSHCYLSRIFSAQTGQTITQYLRQLRMDRAAQLLRDGRHNVTEVALEVGYNSLSHFSAVFHETFGCCPGLYPLKTPTQRNSNRGS